MEDKAGRSQFIVGHGGAFPWVTAVSAIAADLDIVGTSAVDSRDR